MKKEKDVRKREIKQWRGEEIFLKKKKTIMRSCGKNRKSDKKGKRFVRTGQTWPSTDCGEKKKSRLPQTLAFHLLLCVSNM